MCGFLVRIRSCRPSGGCERAQLATAILIHCGPHARILRFAYLNESPQIHAQSAPQ